MASQQIAPAHISAVIGSARQYLLDVERQGFSGVVLVRLRGGPLLLEGYGYADCERKRHMTAEAILDIGSITKAMTAVAVLTLVADGKVSLSDSIGRFIDRVPPDKAGITIEHLLRHTSGLPESLGKDEDYVNREWLIEHALGATLLSPPGKEEHYSNVGYSLLGAIIELVTALPYEAYARTRLFGPAGLHQTGYMLPWETNQLACGRWDGRRYGATRDYFSARGPSWHLMANGGMHTNIEELVRWFDAALSGALIPHNLTDVFSAGIEHRNATVRYLQGSGSNIVFTATYLNFRDAQLVVSLLTNDSAWPKERVLPGLLQRLRPLYTPVDSGG